jgi:chemotaxis protein MotB
VIDAIARLMTGGVHSGGQAPVWMISFVDTMSLVLCFFILMFSMNSVDEAKYGDLAKNVRTFLGTEGVRANAPPAAATLQAPTVSREGGQNLDYIARLVESRVANEPALAGVVIHRLTERLAVSLPTGLLFESGSAAIQPAARRPLFDLVGLFANLSNDIAVVGHADPSTVRSGAFADNWELSYARARAVAAVLRDAGYGRPVATMGAGDSRFGDLAANLSLARRTELARRVDIVVHATRGGAS